MDKKRRSYPKDQDKLLNVLVDLSKPYNSRTEWYEGDVGSYNKTSRSGLLDKVAEIHGWEILHRVYPEDQDELLNILVDLSKPYNSRSEWYENSTGSYYKAAKSGLIDKVAEIHGWEKNLRVYPKDQNELLNVLVESSKPYNGRAEWYENNSASHLKASRSGLIDKVAEIHGWERKVGGYNPDLPGSYYIECVNQANYNTGITNRCLDSRYYGERIPSNTYEKIIDVRFEDGSIPPKLEAEVLKLIRDKGWSYKGPQLYRVTGITEIFVCEDYTRLYKVMEIVKKWENTVTTTESKKTSTQLLTP